MTTSDQSTADCSNKSGTRQVEGSVSLVGLSVCQTVSRCDVSSAMSILATDEAMTHWRSHQTAKLVVRRTMLAKA